MTDLTDTLAARQETQGAFVDRDEAIKAIRAALKRRSGKSWSVTGGRGTGWGWIEIHSPPKRRVQYGYMPEHERRELAELLGCDPDSHYPVGDQGCSIPAGSDYREEFVARAEGRPVRVIGTPYWD
jgi:hypothetical protein